MLEVVENVPSTNIVNIEEALKHIDRHSIVILKDVTTGKLYKLYGVNAEHFEWTALQGYWYGFNGPWVSEREALVSVVSDDTCKVFIFDSLIEFARWLNKEVNS